MITSPVSVKSSTSRLDIVSAPQPSGGVIFARHIEEPKQAFTVRWRSPAYFNTLWFEETTRTQSVLAETPEGALQIAKYHHYRGSDFAIVQPS